jgi:hypothetical protein
MKLYLQKARGSFTASLFEPKQVNNQGKAKYSVASIITPETRAFAGDANPDSPAGQAKGYKWGDVKTEMSKAIMDAANGKWGAKALDQVTQLKAQNRLPLHDGAEKATTPGYAGNLYMNSGNELRPHVRNRNGSTLEAKDGVIYPGCYIDVVVDIWAQDNIHGKRVNASLLSVTFNSDGERLAGGATSTDDDYAAIPQETQAAAAATGAGAGSLFGA